MSLLHAAVPAQAEVPPEDLEAEQPPCAESPHRPQLGKLPPLPTLRGKALARGAAAAQAAAALEASPRMEEFGLNFLPQYDHNGDLLTARLALPSPAALDGAAPHSSNPRSSTGKQLLSADQYSACSENFNDTEQEIARLGTCGIPMHAAQSSTAAPMHGSLCASFRGF